MGPALVEVEEALLLVLDVELALLVLEEEGLEEDTDVEVMVEVPGRH